MNSMQSTGPAVQSFRLTLASQSPRRRELLREAGYSFDVEPPDAGAEDEPRAGETPPELVERLAKQKAANVAPRIASGIVIGCDTVADCEGHILGKPRDSAHAREMLAKLRGRTHHVYSGLCVWRRPDDRVSVRVASAKLRMAAISDGDLQSYLDSRQWEGKAGAFGFQDELDWLKLLAGDPSTVVGLPLRLLADMLHEMGLREPR